MTRPTNQHILDFMTDLVRIQGKHDLWIQADESSPMFVSNDQMGEEIQIFWECAGEPSEGKENLIALLEPERLTTEKPEEEKSPFSSVSLKGTRPDDQ